MDGLVWECWVNDYPRYAGRLLQARRELSQSSGTYQTHLHPYTGYRASLVFSWVVAHGCADQVQIFTHATIHNDELACISTEPRIRP